MKAWKCWEDIEGCGTIIFAETAGKARYIAICSESLGEGLSFKDIRVRRVEGLDAYYDGRKEMDWFNETDRFGMVHEGGFMCSEDYFDPEFCKECSAETVCDRFQDWIKEAVL